MSCEWVGWCGLSASEQAAWIQAGGSIAALIVAVSLGYWQWNEAMKLRKEDTELREKKELDIAVSLTAKLFKAIKLFKSNVDLAHDKYYSRDSLKTEWPMDFLIAPEEIRESNSYLHEMGDPGTALNKAIYHCTEMREYLSNDGAYLLHNSKTPHYETHLNAAKKYVDLAYEAAKKLLA